MFDKSHTPFLKGLVLAGGYSTRMGVDKAFIKWHGIEQCYYLADLLKEFCDEIFISCREEQQNDFNTSCKLLTDKHSDIGPVSGILAAFEAHPDKAWLILACDMPLLDKKIIGELISKRDITKTATAFMNADSGFPEPMFSIWEPASFPILKQLINEGNDSPNKILREINANMIETRSPESLMNVNTPEDMQLVMEILKKKKTD